MSSTAIQRHDWEGAGVVPPRRLGALLTEARSDKGLTLEEIVERSDGRLSITTLASVERGTTYVTEEQLEWLTDLYDIETASLVPSRSQLVIDLEDRRLGIEDRRSVRIHKQDGSTEVLARYLAMVYSMRHVEPGTPVTLRVDDLDVLGEALSVNPRDVASHLHRLMADPEDLISTRHGQLARKVLVPAAGILVALVAAGSLVLVDRGASNTARPPAAPISQPATTAVPSAVMLSSPVSGLVSVGQAVIQERNADGTPGPVQVREG